MNKMKMYLALREWIDIGTADIIYDSSFQCPEYACYVIEALIKNTPKKHVPGYVLEQLENELVANGEVIPRRKSWLKRFLRL